MNAAEQLPILEVDRLSLEFRARGRTADVLSAVSFDLRAGETLCLVGESGCGKSMTVKSIGSVIMLPKNKSCNPLNSYKE